jgi:iron complex outermembrane recepter protein
MSLISRKNTLTRAAFAVSASMVALTSSAFAQQAAAKAEAANDGDIVVTAQFRQQRLQDAPLAITAVDAATMEAKSQNNLAQLADSAPNVSFKPQGGTFGPSISASIRGVGQNDFNPAYEPGVAIYIDDVYYPQLTGAVFDLLDLDRVEILRGPQGILTGRNSEGGAIKLFSKKPTGSGGGFAEATYGSSNRVGVRGSADFKLTDSLFGRISGSFKQMDGYVDRLDFGCVYPAGGSATFKNAAGVTVLRNPAGGVARGKPVNDCKISSLGGVGYGTVRGTLRYAPNDQLDWTFSADYIRDEHTVAGEILTGTNTIDNVNTNAATGVPHDDRYICGPFCNFAGTGQPSIIFAAPPVVPGANGAKLLATSGNDRSSYNGWGVSNRIHYEISENIAIDAVTGYRKFQAIFDTDDDLSPTNLNFGHNDLKNWNFSQELRVGGKAGDAINWTLGGFYFKQKSTYYSSQDIRYIPVFPLQFIQPDDINADSKAAFAHLGWEVSDGFNLSGGVRYTSESKQYHYYRLNFDGTINGILDPVGAASGAGKPGALTGNVTPFKGSRWDWRISADYRISPEFMFYGTVSTGFKGGGTNPRPFNSGQLIPFNPETLMAYEIGAKSDLLDRKLRLNVSAFINKYKDIILPVTICPTANPAQATPCAARVNGGDADVKGFELEASIKPTAGFLVDASLSYLSYKFTRLSAPALGAGATLSDPQAPSKWKWSFGAQYEADLGGAGTLTPRIDAAYQSTQFSGTFAANRSFIKPYTVANGRLTWRNEDRDLDIALEVTNLTNKYHILTVFDLRSAGAGFRKEQPGRPREWAVTVKKKF